MYFVDFLREPTYDNDTGEVIDAHPSFYESIQGGLPDIRKRVEGLQRKFNEESKAVKLELVLFQDALTHLMRISRLLAMDRGSVLLVGVGGSGKQSLSRLAAYIAGQPCIEAALCVQKCHCWLTEVQYTAYQFVLAFLSNKSLCSHLRQSKVSLLYIFVLCAKFFRKHLACAAADAASDLHRLARRILSCQLHRATA